jgi:pyruvate dehydrogenase E2 component (dihydrolipoamide acetyltransferase)
MSLELAIPKLGMTMKEATIAKWAKGEGQWVEPGEVVLVIETEKITYEVEAPGGGYLKILEPQGAVLPVGGRVGLLLEDREAYQSQSEAEPAAAPQKAAAGSGSETAAEAEVEGPAPVRPAVSGVADRQGRVKASPLARKIAKKQGVDLRALTGSGPGGRIVQKDVLRYLEEAVPRAAVTPEAPVERAAERSVAAVIPIEGMRRRIFEHMHRSLQETAQITLTSEADATELVKLRRSLVKRHEPDGVRISFNAILVRILAQALREHPHVNASADGDRIVQWAAVHVGVAMEIADGLIVPVVRDADRRSIAEIQRILDDLFGRARERRLTPDDIQGGTFTLTNLGHLGIDAFTPILNRPESGILGVGRIVEKPVVERRGEGPQIAIRSTMFLSLTLDHRIVDGAPGARFLRRVAEMIEDPYLLIA